MPDLGVPATASIQPTVSALPAPVSDVATSPQITCLDSDGIKGMGVSKNRDTPKWMVYNGKSYSNGWFGGTIIFGNTRMVSAVFVECWHLLKDPNIFWAYHASGTVGLKCLHGWGSRKLTDIHTFHTFHTFSVISESKEHIHNRIKAHQATVTMYTRGSYLNQ